MRAHELRILSQPIRVAWRAIAHCISPGQALAIAVLGLAGVAAFGITPDTTLDAPQVRTISRTLPLPTVAVDEPADDRYWREERVERGDTIGSLLARASVVDPDALGFLRSDANARALYQLKPGRSLQVATDDDGRLQGLRFLADSGELLTISRAATGFVAARTAPPDDTRLTLRAGEIETTLFAAADAADLPDPITISLADIFGGQIDFYHDLRRGDRFAVLYETRYVDGEPVGTGRVVAAEFASGGRTLRAFLWRSPDGTESYYNEDGRNSRNAFLRSPMEFSRVTSGFTLARLDPVLHTMRAHRGIDFAAPVGTPVRATADGVVTFVGQQTGYGNVIMVKHDGRYATVYAHLSRFSVDAREGTRVRQGQTIGFVGQSGWATGPHLHYELRVDNEPRDPLTVALPMATPITDEQRPAFASAIAPLAGELAVVRELPVKHLVAAN
ncbi:MAG TPA: peptidoglycan DD-metalloendopeptidase family protein [Casimicrobiaceae bacterium]|nr:peptidoglycan DD-metalloendopeptidase family protein [Casimicrobiaceae bacterium]